MALVKSKRYPKEKGEIVAAGSDPPPKKSAKRPAGRAPKGASKGPFKEASSGVFNGDGKPTVDGVSENADLALENSDSLPARVENHDSRLPVAPEDRNLVNLYMREMAKAPLLSAAEERELALKIFDHKDTDALRKLVQANLRFVVKIAFEYAKYGARVLDLIQEGNVGLIKAVQDFNPYKDVRLTTYAVYWIRSYIQDYLLRNWSIVRIGTTASQKKLFYRLKKEQDKFEREGLKPEPKAIAMDLNVDEADVKMMQERMSGRDQSLSAPRNSEESSRDAEVFSNRVPDSTPLISHRLEDSEQAALFHQALDEFVVELDEREKTIFQQRLLSEKPRTLVEIGNDYGFTKERARQLEERVKKKLKDFLAKYYPDISLN